MRPWAGCVGAVGVSGPPPESPFGGEPFLARLAAFARERMGRTPPGHGWGHIERVGRTASWLAEEVGARKEIVLPAVLLHDVGRVEQDETGVDHAVASAAVAREMLRQWGFPAPAVEEIAQCILAHRFSTGFPAVSREAQVLSDADKLDALGAVGIVRTFLHGGASGRGWEDSIQHFYDKLLRLTEHIHTEPARRLAQERIAYMEDFLQRLTAEQGIPPFQDPGVSSNDNVV